MHELDAACVCTHNELAYKQKGYWYVLGSMSVHQGNAFTIDFVLQVPDKISRMKM